MLFDTCIIIDLLRGSAKAAAFVEGLDIQPSLSVLTATELVAGCKSEKERSRISQVLATCDVRVVDLAIAERAGAFMHQFSRSHRLEAIDALIAATAAQHDLPLATHNLKHFPMFPRLKRPY
jgi:predicted nucleic acid-binding protein